MRDKIETYLRTLKNQVVEINRRFSKKTKIIASIVLVILLVFAFVTAAILNKQSYATLFTGLNEQEATEIMAKLQESKVDYKNEGGTILVPEEKEQELKASLVSEGYPKSGLTYDVFKNNIDLMSTDFEKNSYKIFDLQDRLASTIKLFDGVKDATVTLAIGSDKKYVLESDKVNSSASVVVIMEDGGAPSSEQIRGVQRLVAKSVPGMKLEDVVIVDGDGREVSSSTADNSQEGSAKLKMNLEREIENTTKAKVLHLLVPIFGEDNVRVTVKSTVDVDKKIKEITNYTPSQDNKGVASKEVTTREVVGDKEQVGGIAGTDSNADVPIYPGVTTDGNQIYFKDEKALDYLVSQVKEQVQSDSGVMTDLTVSVALDSKELSTKKSRELKKLVANTAGIDTNVADDKVAIFNTQFYQDDNAAAANGFGAFMANSKSGKFIVIGIILLLLIGIIAAVLLAMKKKKAKVEEEEKEVEEGILEEGVHTINLEDIKPTRESELRDEIREFADHNPEISAQLIKTWLRGEDGNE